MSIALLIGGAFAALGGFALSSHGIMVSGAVLFVGGVIREEMAHQTRLLKEIRDLRLLEPLPPLAPADAGDGGPANVVIDG